jgi:hypothetical protein
MCIKRHRPETIVPMDLKVPNRHNGVTVHFIAGCFAEATSYVRSLPGLVPECESKRA